MERPQEVQTNGGKQPPATARHEAKADKSSLSPTGRVETESRRGWVRVGDMEIYAPAQRKLRRKWVVDHLATFEPEQLGTPVINYVDGKYYVIDGQHRQALLMAKGWEDRKIECEIYDARDSKGMARLFLGRNDRVHVRTFDEFIIRIVADDPIAVAIKKVVESQGLVLDAKFKEGHVGCVQALERLYMGEKNWSSLPEKERASALAHALSIAVAAWGPTAMALSGNLIEGIGLVHLRYGGAIDREALIRRLASIPAGATGVLGRARGMYEIRGGKLSRCVAAVVVEAYNRSKQTKRLESWWR